MMPALVSVQQAKQVIDAADVAVRVVEVVSGFYPTARSDSRDLNFALFGYAQINIDQLEVDGLWTLQPDAVVQQQLQAVDLHPEKEELVLIFDHLRVGCGEAVSRFEASSRLYLLLKLLGFKRLSLIHDAAVGPDILMQLAGAQGEQIRAESSALENKHPAVHHGQLLRYPSLLDVMHGKRGHYRLLDARTAAEFNGHSTGYDYVPLAGKIPTAEHIDSADFIVTADKTNERLLSRLAEVFRQKDISSDDRLIWYCGTAWRASRMCTLTRALGYTNASIYDGGWYEWQRMHPEHGRAAPQAVRLSCD